MTNQTIIVAGGCFWCIEHDIRHLPGVVDVVSGYTGDTKESATYDMVSSHKTKHREAIYITYDPSSTSFRALAQAFCEFIDPTDGTGQFADRGYQYEPVLYFKTPEEKSILESIVQELDESGIYAEPIAIHIEPEQPFYPAESYHQNYAAKNPDHYQAYRIGSERESFVQNTCTIRETKNIQWKIKK